MSCCCWFVNGLSIRNALFSSIGRALSLLLAPLVCFMSKQVFEVKNSLLLSKADAQAND